MPRPPLPANDGINLIMKNKTILTGDTTGIGVATAKLLSAEGAKTSSVLSHFEEHFTPDGDAPLSGHSTGQIARHIHSLLDRRGMCQYVPQQHRQRTPMNRSSCGWAGTTRLLSLVMSSSLFPLSRFLGPSPPLGRSC
jgi:hypothetical protein